MKNILIIILVAVCFLLTARAQDCPSPRGCITITREAGEKALADADKVKALEAEAKAKDQAIADLRDLLNKIRIDFAASAGENSALKQNAISDRAIIDLLLKHVRPKKIGLINF